MRPVNVDLASTAKKLSNAELFKALQNSGSREVNLTGANLQVPYRCIGGVIFAMQRANIRMKIGFVSEPPDKAN
jgi:hypothetical protein